MTTSTVATSTPTRDVIRVSINGATWSDFSSDYAEIPIEILRSGGSVNDTIKHNPFRTLSPPSLTSVYSNADTIFSPKYFNLYSKVQYDYAVDSMLKWSTYSLSSQVWLL